MKNFLPSLLLIVLLTSFAFPAFAQITVEWDKAIENDRFRSTRTLLATEDGGSLMAGAAPDYWIIKLDSAGNQEWEKFYGGDRSESLTAAIATPDGGYLLGGTSDSATGGDKSEDSFEDSFDMWIVKLDAAGNMEWDRTYGGDGFEAVWDMVMTAEGDYLLAGHSTSEISGSKTDARRGYQDYWIVKLDAAGNKLWDKTYGGEGREHPSTIISMPDNGFMVGGTSDSGISGNKTAASRGEEDYWLVRADAQGNKLWDKAFGGEENDVLNSILRAENNTLLLVGHSFSGETGDKTAESRGGYDYWLVKIDEQGNQLWDKAYGGSSWERMGAATTAHGGGYLIGGQSSSLPSGEKSENRIGRRDLWIIKVDEEGNLLWDKTLGGSEDEDLISLTAVPDGGYIAGGLSRSGISGNKTDEAPGDRDFWMIKFREGETPPPPGTTRVSIAWDKTYASSTIMAIEQHPDGGYLLGGAVEDENFWIARVDEHGAPAWEKSYGGSSRDFLTSVQPTADGGFLLGGSSRSPVSGDKTAENRGAGDFWIIKVDAAGNKLWDRAFGGDSYESLSAIVPAPDGGYLLGGSSLSDASGDKSEDSRGEGNAERDFWIVKIDAEGNKLWDRTFGGGADDAVSSIVLAPEGGYLLAGYAYSGNSGDKSEPNLSPGNPDFWVVKIDEQGNKEWDKAYGGSSYETIQAALNTEDGGYLLAGYSASPVSGDRTAELKGEVDYWLVKTDASGNKLWDKSYGGDGYDQFMEMIATDDGGYLLGGQSGSPLSADKTENSRGGADYWVVKIDAEGNKEWDKTAGGSSGDYLRAMLETEEGFLLGGISVSNISGDKTEDNTGIQAGWLVKITVEEPMLRPEPTAGHVSGGGWFNVPVGAISENPAHQGRATFAFMARQRGEDDEQARGHALLTIPRAGFRFHATDYEWMHVDEQENIAFMKGSGELNREEGFSFLISVTDQGRGPQSMDDTFRMIIWDSQQNIVFDNQRSAETYARATETIDRGSITIHRSNPWDYIKAKEALSLKVYPVPLANEGVWLEFPASDKVERWELSILDMYGKEMAQMKYKQPKGENKFHWILNHQDWPAGVYNMLISKGGESQQQQKIIK